MSKPSQVVVLVEDERQQRLLYRYLRSCGLTTHDIRVERSPLGEGSGEQFVRNNVAKESKICRRRQAHVQTALIVMIDADVITVDDRLKQLERALKESGQEKIDPNDPIATLVPRRKVETWILALKGEAVDEVEDYKGQSRKWSDSIANASDRLYEWVRSEAAQTPVDLDSLIRGVRELRRLSSSGAERLGDNLSCSDKDVLLFNLFN